MSLTEPYLRHEAQDSSGHEDCDHDHAEKVPVSGSGFYAICVWICPDCGLRETEAWKP